MESSETGRDSIFKTLYHYFSLKEIIAVSGIVLLTFVSGTFFLPKPPFQSDLSAYTYASYAISRGVVPYREIFLAHPPLMYLTKAFFVGFLGFNYLQLRLSQLSFCALGVFLTYLLSRQMLGKQNSSSTHSVISTIIYAFLVQSFVSMLEVLLTLFTLAGVVAYVSYRRSEDRRIIVVCGFLLGCALMTTMRALFFIGVLVIFHIADTIWKRRYKDCAKDLGAIVIGMTIPATVVLLWVNFWLDALTQFITQTILYPIIRGNFRGLSDRIFHVSSYLGLTLPLIFLAALGVIYSFRMARKNGEALPLLPAFVYFFLFFYNALLMINLFQHYFFYLSPYLAFLAVLGGLQLKQLLWKDSGSKMAAGISLIVLGAMIGQVAIPAYQRYTVPRIRQNPYDAVNYVVGRYVSNLTSRDDRIWTSEGAIAFFADRLIQPPNSTLFPFHHVFTTVFGYYFDTPRGYNTPGYEHGFLTTEEFVEGWESDQVKVIVVIRGSGWVPYPDEMIWRGFQNQAGASPYIEERYTLKQTVGSPSVPYEYEIWVRDDQ